MGDKIPYWRKGSDAIEIEEGSLTDLLCFHLDTKSYGVVAMSADHPSAPSFWVATSPKAFVIAEWSTRKIAYLFIYDTHILINDVYFGSGFEPRSTGTKIDFYDPSSFEILDVELKKQRKIVFEKLGTIDRSLWVLCLFIQTIFFSLPKHLRRFCRG